MARQCGAVDENIVQEHKHKVTQERTKNMIHQTLKGGWCICKTKWHDLKLEMAMMGLEGCFEFILFQHSNLMVSRSHVQFGEVFGSS